MSSRRLNIGIRSGAERSKTLRETMRRVARGDGTPQKPELYFENAEELRRILTVKRLELLLVIARRRSTNWLSWWSAITRTSVPTSRCLSGSVWSAS